MTIAIIIEGILLALLVAILPILTILQNTTLINFFQLRYIQRLVEMSGVATIAYITSLKRERPEKDLSVTNSATDNKMMISEHENSDLRNNTISVYDE